MHGGRGLLDRLYADKFGPRPFGSRPESDAEFIDDDVYSSAQDMQTEITPQGLLDRLYQERLRGRPMVTQGTAGNVPTTKGPY